MTDRELLLENNAKLKTIQETLKNKILAIGDKSITVELPEEFNPSNPIYFKVNDNTILFANKQTDRSKIGIWIYHIKEKSWKKGWDNATYIDSFIQVGDDCFMYAQIYEDTLKGCVVYRADTDTIEQIWTARYGWNRFTKVKDGVLIGTSKTGSDGVNYLHYNAQTKIVTPIDCDVTGLNYHIQCEDALFLSTGSSSKPGLYRWNDEDLSITKILDFGYQWEQAFYIDGKYFIHSIWAADTGVLLYDSSKNTLTQIYSEGYRYQEQNFIQLDKYVFFSSSLSAGAGLFCYNLETNTLEKVSNEGYTWVYISKFKDYYLCSAANAANGLYKYSPNENLFEQINETQKVYKLIELGDDALFCSGSPAGLYLFNSLDNSIITLDSSSRASYIIKNNKIFFYSTGSVKGILEYSIIDKSAILGFETLSYWVEPVEFENKILFRTEQAAVEYSFDTGVYTQLKFANTNGPDYTINTLKFATLCFMSDDETTAYGLWKYNSVTGTNTKIANFNNYNELEDFGTYCIIRNKSRTVSIKYDLATDKARILSYKLEV